MRIVCLHHGTLSTSFGKVSPVTLSCRCALLMGSTAVKNAVCRPSFDSVPPAYRPDQRDKCIQFNCPGIPHCPAEIDQLCFLHGGLE